MILKGTARVAAVLLTVSGCLLAQNQATHSPAAPLAPPAAASPAPAPIPEAGPEPEPLEKTSPQLPNSPSYQALTAHDKLDTFVRRTYSPYTFASVLFNATYAQMVGDWPTYGGGMQGFGKRFGATLANTELSGFFKIYLLPTYFHEDPRYFPSGKTGLIPRAWYAGTRVLVGRKDDGKATFNWSEMLSNIFIASVSNAYYPRRDRGFPDTVSRGFGGVSSDALSNVLREFWPDISRTFHKHEPERMKRMEERIPSRVGVLLSPEPVPQQPAPTAPVGSSGDPAPGAQDGSPGAGDPK